MLERFRHDLGRLQHEQKTLIALSRGNLASQCRVHKATLAMLKATSFEHLLQIVTTDLAVLIDVDVVTLGVESTAARTTRMPLHGIHLLRSGMVDQVLGPDRDVLLFTDNKGDPALFGGAAGLVRSQALLRLSFGALGAERADVHRNPQAGDVSSRSRDRAVELSRPRGRDHDRPVARTGPLSTSAPAPDSAAGKREGGDATRHKPIFPALPEPVPLARFSAADDLRAAIGLWAAWLAGERRASAHTIAAYGRDLAFFLDFLAEHLGAVPSLAAIDATAPGRFPRLSGAARRRRR